MAETFTIADTFEAFKSKSFAVDLDAPLPLGYVMAVERAIQMRNSDPSIYTWRAIAMVIKDYHGFDRCADWWRRELLASGRVERRPKGNSYTVGAHPSKLKAMA